jgi:hypothetical protein
MDERACPGCEALQRRVAELEAQVERLKRLLDEPRRAGRRPGRKAGPHHGRHAHRP